MLDNVFSRPNTWLWPCTRVLTVASSKSQKIQDGFFTSSMSSAGEDSLRSHTSPRRPPNRHATFRCSLSPPRGEGLEEEESVHTSHYGKVSLICSNCCSLATNKYSQCTTKLLVSLRGFADVGCQTRQSSFMPFMLLKGCKENCEVTTPLSEERLVDWPFRSVSQERRGGGWAMERQNAACR